MSKISDIKSKFKNEDLLTEALTHSSWVNENERKRRSNERLEFLGDAVLELVVTEELFKKMPLKEEGYLTALRANLVNTTNLALVAQKLNLGEELFMSKGESRENSSILADAVESLIGAIYMDRGTPAATEFIEKYIMSDLPNHLKKPIKSPKSILQEYVQSKGFPAPRYKVIRSWGPDHAKEFEVEVLVNGEPKGQGTGRGKNESEQKAAAVALEKLSLKD